MNNQGYREIFKFDAANLKILNDTLRALWKKIMGRVEMKDLSDAARKVIDSKATAGDVESTVSQSAQEIMTSVENTANGLRSEFNQTAGEIRAEVSRKQNADDPAGALDTKNGVVIDENGVHITGANVEIETGESDGDDYIRLTGSGIDASSLSAPNVTPRYDGPATLYVDPNATSAQIAAGNYHRSLADALARLDKKWVGKNVTINLAAGMVEYGTLSLAGVSGGCWITIQGSSSNHAKLVGRLNLYYNASPIAVKYLDVDMTASSGYGIYMVGSTATEVNTCVVTGTGASGSHAIEARYGTAVYATACETYDCDRSLYGSLGGTIHAANCKGNCRVGANKTTMYLEGTQPCDSTTWTVSEYAGKVYTASITVDQGSKPTAEAEPTTVNYNFTYADSYAGGWSYFSDEDVRQGYVGGKRIYGTIWFNASTIKTALTGKTIKQASLRLYMQSGVGRGVNVSVQMYGTNMAYDGRSGAPALTTSYGTIGSTAPGQLNEITIPTQVITDIVNGTIQALVLYSDDTDYYSGRSYSKNYARFDGSTSGDSSTRPRLTVVYS